MEKILFVIAMEKEAIDIAEKLQLERLEYEKNSLDKVNSKYKIYRKENISLIITGIGKEQAAIRLTQYLENNEKPDLIINIGYVGSTRTKIGTWVNVNKSYNYEWQILSEEKYIIKGFEGAEISKINDKTIKKLPCYSAESFVTETNMSEEVVFDMELYSIQLLCYIYNIELISLKKVSDNLSLNEYYKNIDMKEIFELTSGLKYLEYIVK